MSALGGAWRFDAPPGAERDCARILAAQALYGPDDSALWGDAAAEDRVALGRCLYRRLPEDAHDRQPLQSSDGRLVLAADIRLDNREELAATLDIPQADSAALCDASVLLACWERWGERSLDRLAGDFAFAIWDSAAQRLTLARDLSGQRPLHYHQRRGLFAFATMPQGLLAIDGVSHDPDEEEMLGFLAMRTQRGGRSFYKDIARLEPAQIMTVTSSGTTLRRWWTPQSVRRDAGRSAEDYAEGLRHHLDQAVASRLRGTNGAVATHLSGGFDSGAVAATAARVMAKNGGRVVAFTAVPREGFDGAAGSNRFGDEGPLAAMTAAMHPNIEHVLVRAGHRSPLAEIERIFALYQRPLPGLSNAVWLHAINEAARDRALPVLLTGQFGNMTVSYNGLELLPELLRAGRLMAFGKTARALVAHSDMRGRGVLARAIVPLLPTTLTPWLGSAMGTPDLATSTMLAREPIAALQGRPSDDARPWHDSVLMRMWVVGRFDIGNVNKGVLAGWGIDQRDPTIDKRLLEYCLSIPTEQFLAGGKPRALARRALADRLPLAVLDDRRKGLQSADWFEGLAPLREQVAAEVERIAACAPARRLLDIERMRRLVADWPPQDGWEREDVQMAYRFALLRGLSAGFFMRRTADRTA